jgi:hypothetical protein
MIKLVNGVPVQMTQEEQDAWTASLPASNPVPAQVSALQGLLAINAAGLSEAYSEWASSESRTFSERAFIDKATHWNRTDPVLLAGATALELTSDQVDQLFISASAL